MIDHTEYKLTPRQKQVLELMCRGLPTRVIAEQLGLSHNTVKEHRALVLKRMGVDNAVALVNKFNDIKRTERLAQRPELEKILSALPSLLVVEDDEFYRELVVSSLKLVGLPCRSVSNRADFHAAMAVERPDVVVLDLNLGEDDGLNIARELRETISTCVIVIMTTRGEVDQRIDGLATGADAYLVKPVDMRELVTVVRNLHRRRLEWEYLGAST